MSRVSIGRSCPRPFSGRKTLRRCRNNEGTDNVIVIDVDSEHLDNVIILDAEYSPKKVRGRNTLRKDKKSLRNVIYIDDDEIPENNHSDAGADNGSSSAHASSSRNSFPATGNFSNAGEAAEGERENVKDNVTPVRLSKCKRTYSGKASSRNQYGLGTDSENDASEDDDYPDIVLMEDSSGKVQEQWKKAFSRKKKDIHSNDSVIGDHASTSRGINGNQDRNVNGEGDTRVEAPFPSSTSKSNDGAKAPFPTVEEDADFGGRRNLEDPDSEEFFLRSIWEAHLRNKYGARQQSQAKDCEPGTSNKHFEERREDPTSSYSSQQEQLHKTVNCKSRNSKDEETPVACPPKSGIHSEKDRMSTVGSVSGKYAFSKNLFVSKDDNRKGSCQDKRQPVSDIPQPGHTHSNEAKLRQNENRVDNSQNGDVSPPVESSIINEREKLKETDEYKRAVEEEWASRQKALQLQAEEAQRLRQLLKRRKAESMRLLDMERRQKQRLDEIRDTQKKDEENMNLKETLRVEVRNNLKRLELSCHGLASVLHLLGIRVGGWPNPSPKEVQMAYKKALLTFHPDRASRSDMRQQVEAEEKFKLINRLKDKFSPSL